MPTNRLPNIYAKDFRAFVDKAFYGLHGKHLNPEQKYVDYLVENLEKLMAGGFNRLLVNLPGRHLKTFICSVCLPAFALGQDPTLKFLIAAHSSDLAEDIVRQIRELLESDWYCAAFKTRVSNGHARKDDFTTKRGGRVRAAPIGSVTGKGGDYVIFDDAHNVEDYDNDRRKDKVVQAFEILVSRRDGGKLSRILVVGHRVAEDDLSAHILGRGDFEHICLPLFAPKKITLEVGGEPWVLQKGESLRRDAFPPDEIDIIRRNHRGPSFWLYYQQGLGPKTDDLQIKVSDFPFIARRLGRRLPPGPVVISVDPAQKTQSASRNVIHVYFINGKQYELIDAFADKCSFHKLALKVKKFVNRYNAYFVLIENTARGGDLIEKMNTELSIPVITANPRGSKADRLRKFAPIIRAKRIGISHLAAVEEAIDEIVAYPNSPYDDHVDALTNFLEHAPELSPDLPPRLGDAGGAMAIATGSAPRTQSDIGVAYASRRSIFDSPFAPHGDRDPVLVEITSDGKWFRKR